MKFSEIINQEKPTLVDFHATWCGPCKVMEPYIKQFKAEIGDRMNVLKVDVDKNQTAAQHFKIRGVPTLMLFKNGEVLWRQSGVVYPDMLKKLADEYAPA